MIILPKQKERINKLVKAMNDKLVVSYAIVNERVFQLEVYYPNEAKEDGITVQAMQDDIDVIDKVVNSLVRLYLNGNDYFNKY